MELEVPMYKNNEGYPDPTAGRAVRKADKPPEEVINFRRAMKLMSVICHVRILGKVTVVDDKGRRWWLQPKDMQFTVAVS